MSPQEAPEALKEAHQERPKRSALDVPSLTRLEWSGYELGMWELDINSPFEFDYFLNLARYLKKVTY